MSVSLESLIGEGLIDTGSAIKVRNPITIVRKSSDETVTSSAALQSDNELLFAIGASEKWLAEFELFVTAATASRIQVALNVPSGAAGFFGTSSLIFSATGVSGSYQSYASSDLTDTGAVQCGCAGASTPVMVILNACIVNSTTPGNVTLRWAQGVSGGTATTVKANSYLKAIRISS